ncbi:MAG: hypothetical protein JWP11_207 [Frankiales bacterium]|nr:hypothetical protein [Frankiales bacterium]
MAFWRRSRGRHALGAAVTSLPTAPVFAPPPVPAPVLPPAPVLQPAAVLPPPPAALDWSFPELQSPPGPVDVPASAGPRVELTFRDGTTAALDATQARALEEIAQVLTRRNEVKH